MNTRTRPIRPILLSALLVAAMPSASAAQSFNLFANAFLDSTRTPTTRITAEVPFRSLVFFKREGSFDARYHAYISISRAGEESSRPTTYVLHGTAAARTYEETRRRDQKSRTWREFRLAPGDYVVNATLVIDGTHIALQRSVTLSVPDFLTSGMGFGTPAVLSVPLKYPPGLRPWSEASDDARVTEPPSSTTAGFERQPAVRFSIFVDGDLPGPVPCDIYYEVVGSGDHRKVYGKRRVMLTGEHDEYLAAFNADDWAPGVYRVNLRARTSDPQRDATATADIRVDVTRAMLGVNFEDTLEILGLIASQEEIKPLRDAPASERAAAWAEFWASRDPDPSSDVNEALVQYIERIQYVSEYYAQFGPGWRSDRGRVYIRYGAPDQIDTAMDQRTSGEYEIWRYFSINRSFVFYDMFGVGDYKLVEGDL